MLGKSQQYLVTKEPVKNMKAFAAACLISTALAFKIDSIEALNFKDFTTEKTDPKKLLSGIPQLKSAPAFNEAEGYDELVNDLIADQKACADDAHAECAISIDDESKGAGFGLGKLVEGVQNSYSSLEFNNAATEKQAIDAINEET